MSFRQLPETKAWQAIVASVVLGVATIYCYNIDQRFKAGGEVVTAQVVDKRDNWGGRLVHYCYLKLSYSISGHQLTDDHLTACSEWNKIAVSQSLDLVYLPNSFIKIRTPEEQAWAIRWGTSGITQLLFGITILAFAAFVVKIKGG